MQVEEFLKRVSGRAGLHSRDEAKKAADAVFVTLRFRIQHETGDNIAAQLPTGLKEMWEGGTMEHLKRALAGEEKMDLGGFLAKIAQQMGLTDVRDAETVTCAVFTTLRETITPGAQDKVSHSLPEDIREFWLSCTPMETPEEKHVCTVCGEARETGTPTNIEEPGGHVQVVSEAVLFESPKKEVTRPEMRDLDLPTGYNIDMREAENEAQAREVKEEAPGMAGEHEVAPPAEERVEIVAPPGERSGVEGPGSDQYYRADVQLTEEIEEMLRESTELDAEHVNVHVQAGNVTLNGFVKSVKERDVATDLTARALGVGDIRNELCVEEEHKHGGEHTE